MIVKNKIYFLVGIFCTGMTVEAIITGDTFFGEDILIFDEDPGGFYIAVVCWLLFGIPFLHASFVGDEDE